MGESLPDVGRRFDGDGEARVPIISTLDEPSTRNVPEQARVLMPAKRGVRRGRTPNIATLKGGQRVVTARVRPLIWREVVLRIIGAHLGQAYANVR